MDYRVLLLVFALLAGLQAEAQDSVIKSDLRGLYPATGTMPPPDIVDISNTIDGLQVVGFNPVMREVPNVLIYRVTEDGLERVFEGLALGIQLEPSTRHDLHTEGLAMDQSFKEPPDMKAFTSAARDAGFQVVNYGRFMHMHPLADNEYYLDKTMFEDLRTRLLDPERTLATGEAAVTCVLYDMPSLESLDFEKTEGRYVITGTTSNFQKWRVTFSGVDAAGRLIDKRISAEQLSPASR